MGITTVQFAESSTLIKESAFSNCRALKTINFPETLTGIEFDAFDSCISLERVTLPKSLEGKIDASAFDYLYTEVEYN